MQMLYVFGTYKQKGNGKRTKDKGKRKKGKGQRTKDKGQRTKDKGSVFVVAKQYKSEGGRWPNRKNTTERGILLMPDAKHV